LGGCCPPPEGDEIHARFRAQRDLSPHVALSFLPHVFGQGHYLHLSFVGSVPKDFVGFVFWFFWGSFLIWDWPQLQNGCSPIFSTRNGEFFLFPRPPGFFGILVNQGHGFHPCCPAQFFFPFLFPGFRLFWGGPAD